MITPTCDWGENHSVAARLGTGEFGGRKSVNRIQETLGPHAEGRNLGPGACTHVVAGARNEEKDQGPPGNDL